MRKLIVLLWVFFLPITSTLAQSNDENKEVYDQLKQWAVVKLTVAHMEDLYSFTPDNKGDRGSDTEYNTYKKLHTDYNLFKESINLDSISEILIKGEWKSANRIEFSEYKKELFNSGYKNFKNINYIPKIEDSIPKSKLSRDKALDQINQRFDSLSQQNGEATIVEVIDSSAKESESTKNQNDDIFSIVLNIFIGFLLGISFYYNYKYRKEIKNKRDSSKFKISGLEKQLKQTNQELEEAENKIDDLKGKLKIKDKDRISDSYSSNDLSVEGMPEIIAEVISETRELEISKQHLSEIIYLSSPFQNLTFADEDASKEKTLDSLYVVEFDKQTLTGELSLIMDTDLSRALNSPDFYLETACTYDNVYFNNAIGVQVTEKGEIKLDGQDWNVTKKVRIKFI